MIRETFPTMERGIMAKAFARDGIRIEYPENWTTETDETDEGWSVSIFSPDTAFLMVSQYPEDTDPVELADMALGALRENYPDLEADEVIETLAGFPVVGHDAEFFALDLTNTCRIRALTGPEGSLLLMSQCTDSELATNGEVMRAIAASLVFEDEE